MRSRRASVVRWSVALAPLVVLVIEGVADRLGADPVQALQDRTGFWALTWLLASLAISPLARLLRRLSLLPWRRTLGLAAYAFAALHLLLWAVLDQALDPVSMAAEVAQRRFITAGMAGLLLLTPLAVTSTRGWMQRLGGHRWRRLHMLVHLAAPLALLHEVWRYKLVERQPVLFLSAGGLIVVLRLLVRRASAASAVTPAAPQNRPS